jgi:hypothetical protein
MHFKRTARLLMPGGADRALSAAKKGYARKAKQPKLPHTPTRSLTYRPCRKCRYGGTYNTVGRRTRRGEDQRSGAEDEIHRRNSLTTKNKEPFTLLQLQASILHINYNNTMFVSQVSATSVRRGLAYTQRFVWARGFSSTTAPRADQYDVVIIGRCMFGKSR